MIVALAYAQEGMCSDDYTDVVVVDTDRCTEIWRKEILASIYRTPNPPVPYETYSLECARVDLPALVEFTVFLKWDSWGYPRSGSARTT